MSPVNKVIMRPTRRLEDSTASNEGVEPCCKQHSLSTPSAAQSGNGEVWYKIELINNYFFQPIKLDSKL